MLGKRFWGYVFLINILLLPIYGEQSGVPNLKGVWTIHEYRGDSKITFRKNGNIYSGTFIDSVDRNLSGVVQNISYKNGNLTFETNTDVKFELTYDSQGNTFVGNMYVPDSSSKRGGRVSMYKR